MASVKDLELMIDKELREELIETKDLMQAAIDYINASPCDPDITKAQWETYGKYQDLLKAYRDKRK